MYILVPIFANINIFVPISARQISANIYILVPILARRTNYLHRRMRPPPDPSCPLTSLRYKSPYLTSDTVVYNIR